MKPTIIRGWDIAREDFQKAHREGRLVKLSLDLTNQCNLSCKGCFTREERLRIGALHRDDYKQIIDQAKALGVKAIDFVGAGEPTLDRNFIKILKYLKKVSIIPVVFTNGISLNEDLVDQLYGNNATVVIKLWSIDKEKQDRYTSNGYAEKRDTALALLIKRGFNKGTEIELNGIRYKTTRLGADILVRSSNYDEIPDIFRFCRNNEIMPEIKGYIPVSGISHEDEISAQAYLDMRKDLAMIDEKEYGIVMPPTTYPRACDCTQSIGCLYINLSGRIKGCVGSKDSLWPFNIRTHSLRYVTKHRAERPGFGCGPRLAYQKKKGDCPKVLIKIFGR